MLKRLTKKLNKKSAQSLVEYTLVLAVVVIVCIALLRALGGGVQNTLSAANSGLATASGGT